MTIPSICYITMEKASQRKSISAFSLYCFSLDVLFIQTIAICLRQIHNFLTRFWSSLQYQPNFDNHYPKAWDKKKNSDFELSQQQASTSRKKDDSILNRGDAETVMQNLGIFCSSEDEELLEGFSSNEISGLFDEKEPSLEELKEAFDVFDENRDGYIDGKELQRVLCILGLEEGKEVVNCNKMIRTYDENSDGRIDFNEFLRLMENVFC
ncbi:hypothetical protein F2P56_000008 [Juglans regia]|uniref:EF-hand domain-containing protein n=2 Tax=Juglans regia TaxID=51240 RepID=A0A833Y715_JUGRE|nr:probable calcium-binding protein CML45 [Juglans regia]KAF5479158.1 hypothetical protein F2P56_000008 [Juglans regia]